VEREVSMPVGVVVEKRKSDHPWLDWSWRPVAILPGAEPVSEWRMLESGEGWTRFHAATLSLTLYFSDTEAYLVNLSDRVPSVYVVLREEEAEGSIWPVRVHQVTASPYESQLFEDSGEDIIERIPMTPEMIAWVRAFTAFHHEEETFVKRKRKEVKIEEEKFGKEPIFGKTTLGQIRDGDNEH